MKDGSNSQRLNLVKESSLLKTCKPPQGKYKKTELKLFATAASAVLSKKTTSSDNVTTLKPIYLTNIPDPNVCSSQTSRQGSTLKDKDCYAFWNESNKETYQQLSWLPKTDYPVSDTNLLNGCAYNTEQKSWFSITKIQPLKQNLEKTYLPSFKYIVVDGMAKEDTKETKVTKALKLRLNPTLEQKTIIKKWDGCSRFTYNKALDIINRTPNERVDKFKLRNKFVTVTTRHNTVNNFFNNKLWLLDCPKAIRKGAIDDLVTARKAALTNLKNKNIDHFKLRFRSKKDKYFSLTLEKNNISRKDDKLFIFGNSLNEMKYRNTKQLHKLISSIHPTMDCKLQKDKFNDYYLVIPHSVEIRKQPIKEGVVSIDPGIRKFLALYSPDDKSAHFIASRFMNIIKPLLYEIDNICSEMTKTSGRKKDKLKQKLIRLRKRIHYLKHELLYQSANYITNKYSIVLCPKLNIPLLAALKTTNKFLARELYNSNHCKFFNHLEYKCKEKNVKFLHVSEHYTSQTCHQCGTLHKTNEEIRCCPNCGCEGDRDLIGSLNILLRAVRPIPD